MKKVLLALSFILILGACGNKVDIDGEVITYEELQTKIEGSNSELKEIEDLISTAETDLQEIEDELTKNENEFAELKELADSKKDIEKELEESKTELSSLSDEIENAKDELKALEGEIVKVMDEPIKVNPGVYYFGNDIDPGRYKLTAQEGNRGNVFFRGDNYFGETFGGGKYGIDEYTFYADDGDEIEISIPIYLYPVE